MNKNAVNRLETFRSVFSIQLLCILYFVFPSYLKLYGIRATDCMNNCKPNLLFIFFNLNHFHFLPFTLQIESPCRRCAAHIADAGNGYTVNQHCRALELVEPS